MNEEENKEQERNLRMLTELSRSEAFQVWVEMVAEPVIKALEAELASEGADSLPEVVLRAKLKQLNSLKYIFKDVFEIAKQNLKETK